MFVYLEQRLISENSPNIDSDDDVELMHNDDQRGLLDIFICLIRSKLYN